MGDAKAKTATVRISEELRAEAKSVAAKRRMSLLDFLDAAVADYIKKPVPPEKKRSS